MFVSTSNQEQAEAALSSRCPASVVAVPIFDGFASVRACVGSLWAHTPPGAPFLLVDDGSSDLAGLSEFERSCAEADGQERLIVLLRKPTNGGFVETANLILRLTGRADVILVNSDVVVADGWYQALAAKARASTTVATVSCLTNHGAILSVPDRNHPSSQLPSGLAVAEVAARVMAGSTSSTPRLPTAVGHCVYFRRVALDVVGEFAEEFAPGYGEEVDWSQRALAMGFEHVLADEVFVYHEGGASFGTDPASRERQLQNDRLTAARYPYYLQTVKAIAQDRTSPLAASLLAARRSILGLSVAVDGLCLSRSMTGTQKVVLELTRALASDPRVRRVELLVPTPLPEYAKVALEDIPNVELRPALVGRAEHEEAADVVVRPYQFASLAELKWLEGWGERVVVLQLDFIAFDNPSYFNTYREWQRYRATQRLALAAVDGVGFISATIQKAALDSQILSASLPTAIVYPGAHDTSSEVVEPSVPRVGQQPLEPGFLLQLGVAFNHKNRVFSLRLADELWRSGWDGQLVLAGPEPATGSSIGAEQEWLRSHPQHLERVKLLGSVSEAEKRWLYTNSGLVLYPTLSEGFGLVPFEAADLGVPCLSSRQGSLDEVLPSDLLTLHSFDPVLEAQTCRRILEDPQVASAMVASVRKRADDFTWTGAGASLANLLVEVTGRPRNATVAIRFGRDSVSLSGLSPAHWGRRLLDPVADRARDNGSVKRWLLPVGTRRGKFSRNFYHRFT